MADNNTNIALLREKGALYTMNPYDVMLQDPTTDVLVARANTLSESGWDIETNMEAVNAGSSNSVVFYIPTSKNFSVSLTNVAFEESWLALQTGEKFTIGEYEIFGRTASCAVDEVSGKRTITMPETPVGAYVYVVDGSDSIAVPIPTANPGTIDVTRITGAGDKCIEVVYAAKVRVKHLSIKGSSAPSVVKLTMTKTVYDGKTGKPVKTMTVVVPRFQPDGNFGSAGALGSADTMNFSGNAVASKSTQCGDVETVLADIFIEEIGDDALVPNQIGAQEAIELSAGETAELTVNASYGPELVFTAYDITSECAFTSADPSVATVSNGMVSAVSAGDTTITITYKTMTAQTAVTVM